MTPTPNAILTGDCLKVMREWPDGIFHCVVTSPPYWALRSYLKDGHDDKHLEMGSEESPEQYIRDMVTVFREVKRVMRDDGLCWVNIGSTYAGGGRGEGSGKQLTSPGSNMPRMDAPTGYKSGDLVPIPWLLGIALQRDGWWLRMDAIWEKKSPMPESIDGARWVRHRVKTVGGNVVSGGANGRNRQNFPDVARGKNSDGLAQWAECPGCPKCSPHGGYIFRRGSWRPTRAHEYILQLAKSPEYFADKQNVEEDGINLPGYKDRSSPKADSPASRNALTSQHRSGDIVSGKRNPRSVRTFKSAPFSGAHFAAFPPSLPDWCIRASTSHVGCCPECGKQWARVIDHTKSSACQGEGYTSGSGRNDANRPGSYCGHRDETLSYWPSCSCGNWTLDGLKPVGAPEPVPCRVLDPFAGAGTTLLAARRLGRNYAGIELNPAYVAMAQSRLSADAPLFKAQAARQAEMEMK